MFRRLLLLVAGMVSACAGIIVAAMVAGRLLGPDWAADFDHVDICQDRLCLAGIIPGVTSWGNAEIILRGQSIFRLRFNEDSEQATGVYGRTGFVVSGLSEAYALEPIIGEIRLGVDIGSPVSGLRAGALIARFGTPCLIRYSTDTNTLTLYYPFGTANVLVGSASDSFDASSPIYMLVSDMFTTPTACRMSASPNDTFAWQGFRSLWQYVARTK